MVRNIEKCSGFFVLYIYFMYISCSIKKYNMETLCMILSPVFIFLFVMSWIYLLREALRLYKSIRIGRNDITKGEEVLTAVSISYIITALVCGLLTL